MYNQGLNFFLMVILCMVFLGNFKAFADGEKSIYDVLSSKGFTNELRPPIGMIRNNSITKNINRDVSILLYKTRKVAVIKGVPEPSEYYIWLANGSSFDSQGISIFVAKTGNGYIQYMEKNIAFFKSVDLYEFCVKAFNKSTIPIH